MDTISENEQEYSKQIEAIFGGCALLGQDVARVDGKFTVVHNERICVPGCQNILPVYQPIDPSIERECIEHDLDKLKDQVSLIKTLVSSSSSCPTAGTVT